MAGRCWPGLFVRCASAPAHHDHEPQPTAPASSAAGVGASAHAQTGTSGASIDPKEAAKFAALAGEWWHFEGPFAPLHALNPTRVRFIRSSVCSALGLDATSSEPLSGVSVLDVGCGGGILSESLARLGARVAGIDVSEQNVAVASLHAQQDPDIARRVRYECISAESLAARGTTFDVVVASEVIEHVRAPDAFLATLTTLLKPDDASPAGQAPGSFMPSTATTAPTAASPSPSVVHPLIISTISRTPASFALAILAAEHVLRIVPRGTHHWEKFVTPEELATMGRACGLRLVSAAGIEPQLAALGRRWGLGQDLSVNYIAMLQRGEGGERP